MRIKIIFTSFALLAIMLMFSRCEEETNQPLENNTVPPGKVTNVTVENQPAQALLTYSLPADKDLLYVKAVYELQSGEIREVKSSMYDNSLVVDGFADANDHEVKLYAVNRSEVASEPVLATVKPLENPIFGVFRDMKILADFSGIRIISQNPTNANIAIQLLVPEGTEWELYEGIYTSQSEINRSIRGLEVKPFYFGVTIRDRFSNYTDTIFKTITPLYEVELSKLKFSEMHLANDATIYHPEWGLSVSRLWDNTWQWWQRMITNPTEGPQWITFDLGQKAQVSRFTLWNHYDGNYVFNTQSVRYFEMWGCEDSPNPDGSWDNWIKLGSYEIVKPSGLPIGTNTAEDVEVAHAGFEGDFKLDAPKIRYLRIKNLENFGGTYDMDLDEIDVFGDPN